MGTLGRRSESWMILPYECPGTAAASLCASLLDYPASLQYWAKDTNDSNHYASRTSAMRAVAAVKRCEKVLSINKWTTPHLSRDCLGFLVLIPSTQFALSTSYENHHNFLTLHLPANAKELCLPSSAITFSSLLPSLI